MTPAGAQAVLRKMNPSLFYFFFGPFFSKVDHAFFNKFKALEFIRAEVLRLDLTQEIVLK